MLVWKTTSAVEVRVSEGGGVSIPLSAVIGVDLTVDAAEARGAGAGVAVDTVCAVGPVLAGVALALVDVLLAAPPAKAQQACAHKAVHAVPAQASVTAGVWGHRGGGGGGGSV